jgi:hypothetical protein
MLKLACKECVLSIRFTSTLAHRITPHLNPMRIVDQPVEDAVSQCGIADTIPIHDPRGGPVQQAHLFVAVMGASSYTYAEATPEEQLASWIGAHVRAFEFYQGLPKLVVPENTKTGATKLATVPVARSSTVCCAISAPSKAPQTPHA